MRENWGDSSADNNSFDYSYTSSLSFDAFDYLEDPEVIKLKGLIKRITKMSALEFELTKEKILKEMEEISNQ